ncbi:MAG TPA: hypothetical protein VK970_09365, partial [Candidatus Methylacidiphilales bacterium]|nr:hypothetical protein [Candidatus Methylacidiphilales bacterium]
SVPDQGELFTGIWENPQFTGARAVELLIDLIHRGEFGVPDVRLFMLVGGSWRDGKTTVPQASLPLPS